MGAHQQFHRTWAIELGMSDPQRIVAIPNGIADIARTRQAALGELRHERARSRDRGYIIQLCHVI